MPPRRVRTHEPGPSSELRALPSRRLALRIALASPADPRRSKRHRVAARSNFHRECVRSLPGLICSVCRRFAVRITLIVRDCAVRSGRRQKRALELLIAAAPTSPPSIRAAGPSAERIGCSAVTVRSSRFVRTCEKPCWRLPLDYSTPRVPLRAFSHVCAG